MENKVTKFKRINRDDSNKINWIKRIAPLKDSALEVDSKIHVMNFGQITIYDQFSAHKMSNYFQSQANSQAIGTAFVR